MILKLTEKYKKANFTRKLLECLQLFYLTKKIIKFFFVILKGKEIILL